MSTLKNSTVVLTSAHLGPWVILWFPPSKLKKALSLQPSKLKKDSDPFLWTFGDISSRFKNPNSNQFDASVSCPSTLSFSKLNFIA
jgi:hypothetical protein